MKTMIFKSKWKTCFTITAVAFMAAVMLLTGPVMAADNTGTGDIAGDTNSLTDSTPFTLNSITMSLNKIAFLSDGTQLASGTNLPRGTEVRFVIYIDNTTAVGMDDVSVQDVLDPAFAYQAGSMKVDNTLAFGAAEALIYSTVNAVATTLSDQPLAGDVASAVGVTIDVGDSVVGANDQLDIAASSVWAFLFRALMQ